MHLARIMKIKFLSFEFIQKAKFFQYNRTIDRYLRPMAGMAFFLPREI